MKRSETNFIVRVVIEVKNSRYYVWAYRSDDSLHSYGGSYVMKYFAERKAKKMLKRGGATITFEND